MPRTGRVSTRVSINHLVIDLIDLRRYRLHTQYVCKCTADWPINYLLYTLADIL